MKGGEKLLEEDPPRLPRYTTFIGQTKGPGAFHKFQIRLERWLLETETFAHYKTHAQAAFQRVLEDYATKERLYAEGRGLVPVSRQDLPKQLEWLVLYQLTEYTYDRIADWHQDTYGVSVTSDAIRKGVNAAADLVSLQLRPRRRGRQRRDIRT